MTFAGFQAEAFAFYERLEADNSKSFWSAHKREYEQYVREPMRALADELGPEFGNAVVFRPHRDIRFSADKSPYKTYQGMFAERAAAGTGFYCQISADGLLASGGFHSHAPDQVERYREAVHADQSGPALASIVDRLVQSGLSVGGDQLKTRPRGIPADHPRLNLLRYRSLTATRDWPAGPAVYGRAALSLVRQAWRELLPLCDWLGQYVGPARS